MIDIQSTIGKHEKIAFQFSGGKDSTAALFMLQEYWNKITVYWTNPGDPARETVEVLATLRPHLPNFVEIQGNVKEWRETNGMPSDIVTWHGHWIGNAIGMGDQKVSNRFDCCQINLMQPMHDRMLADGVTLIIRGTKDSDMPDQPIESGDVIDGIEFLYPIQNWSDGMVMNFLKEEGAPVADYYEYGAKSAPECMGCTAWWSDKKAAWLRAKHPEQYAAYMKFLDGQRLNILAALNDLDKEIKNGLA